MKKSLIITFFVLAILELWFCFSCKSSREIEYKINVDGSSINVVRTNRANTYRLRGNPDRGYYFDCYIYVPDDIKSSEYLLVEPNNDGFPSDKTLEEESMYVESCLDRYWSMKLGNWVNSPVLIPAMQRPYDETGCTNIYTHALSYEAIHDAKGSLSRVDRQLVAAIKDAQIFINTKFDAELKDKILMFGYSAGGLFLSRFALLYPELVYAMCAGGTQGMFSLPFDELDGSTLNYPLGTSDYYSIVGHEFSLSDWSQIKMFLFNGEIDDNDCITPKDCWPTGQSQIILSKIGKSMKERTETVSEIYRKYTDNAQFILYKNKGHEVTSPSDIENFFKKNMNSLSLVKIKSGKDVIEY